MLAASARALSLSHLLPRLVLASIAAASQELLDSSIELAAGPCPCPLLTAASAERPVVSRLPTLELALSLS